MAMYSALRDAFNDMNKMMIDKQQWQGEHERRIENDAMKRQQQEQQQQQQQMQNEVNAVAVAKARQSMTPQDFNLYEIGNRDRIEEAMAQPGAAEQMELAVGDGSYKWSPADGTFRNAQGQVAQLSHVQAQNRANAFYGIVDMHTDTPQQITLNMGELQKEYAGLIAERKKYNADSQHGFAKRAEIDTKLSSMKQDIANHADFLDPKSGKLLEYYENKTQSLAKRARWAQSIGATDLANLFFKESGNMADAARNTLTIMNKAPSKTGKHWITWYANQDGVINPVTGKEMKQNESFPELVDPASAGAMSRDGFSPAKVPNPKEQNAATYNQEKVQEKRLLDVAKAVVITRTLPRNQVMPNKPSHTAFWKAVDKHVGKKLEGKMAGKDVGWANRMGHEAIEEMMDVHNSFKLAIDDMTTGKWNSSIQRWVFPDGEEMTMKAYEDEYKSIKDDAKKALDYVPTWDFVHESVGYIDYRVEKAKR